MSSIKQTYSTPETTSIKIAFDLPLLNASLGGNNNESPIIGGDIGDDE